MTDIRTDGPTAVGNPTPNGEPAADAPQRLVIPAEAVGDLIGIALRSQEGAAWWRGFVTGHGAPDWVVSGDWGVLASECAVVHAPGPRRGPNGTGRA